MGSRWEEAVRWFRAQPDHRQEVLDSYFDLPVLDAARRFAAGAEFAAAAALLGPAVSRRLLDYGAGNGIASYAFASRGFAVDAVEPDPSAEVGAGAIRALAEATRLPIAVHETGALPLPFPARTFDAVYARQSLHHVPHLPAAAAELWRVLRRGGMLLACREHVADDGEQLARFLAAHPLHSRYGGEHAYPLADYLAAFRGTGFHLVRLYGPADTMLNFHPGNPRLRPLLQLAGKLRAALGAKDRTPGRLYSFLLRRE
jgi:SAM-dependent methyltransferase